MYIHIYIPIYILTHTYIFVNGAKLVKILNKIDGYIFMFIVTYGHLLLCMVIYCCVWSFIVVYGHLLLCIVIHSFFFPGPPRLIYLLLELGANPTLADFAGKCTISSNYKADVRDVFCREPDSRQFCRLKPQI